LRCRPWQSRCSTWPNRRSARARPRRAPTWAPGSRPIRDRPPWVALDGRGARPSSPGCGRRPASTATSSIASPYRVRPSCARWLAPRTSCTPRGRGRARLVREARRAAPHAARRIDMALHRREHLRRRPLNDAKRRGRPGLRLARPHRRRDPTPAHLPDLLLPGGSQGDRDASGGGRRDYAEGDPGRHISRPERLTCPGTPS
jgi:hypothetical protein